MPPRPLLPRGRALPPAPWPCFHAPALTDSPQLPVWQPLTFGGVAAFSRARSARLLVVQSAVAVWVAASVMFSLSTTWFPVITKAIEALTQFGELRQGQLAWPTKDAVLLGENRFLGLVVDLDESGETGQAADLQFEFGRNRIKLVSLLGYTSLPYDPGWRIELNRPVLAPWWGAWRPAIGLGAGMGVFVLLFTSWLALATLGCLPVRLLAWLAGRETTLAGSWRVAAAAWLPGSLWLGGAVLLYSAEQLSLVGLALALGFYLLLGLVYGLVAPFRLPVKLTPAMEGNPFTPPPPAVESAENPPLEAPANPFRTSDS